MTNDSHASSGDCGGPPDLTGSDCCGDGIRIGRRDFLATTGSALLVGCTTGRAFAGPFTHQDGFPVPADKQLDPAWVRALFERGEPTTVSGADLRFIGMPVGGFFAGTVYLGGDGRLWNWDIFNEHHEGAVARERLSYRGQTLRERDGANYVDPPERGPQFQFGLELIVGDTSRTLDRRGWSDVRFRGEYPVGTVDYGDADCPLRVRLEAFSPFVPLDVEASSYPATVLRYRLTNDSSADVRAEILAAFENPVMLNSRHSNGAVRLVSEDRSEEGLSTVFCSATVARSDTDPTRPDVVFEDFESGTYDGWQVEGSAFGTRPREVRDIADYQGDLGAEGTHLVNSHETRSGEDVGDGDRHTGTLLSGAFVISRSFVNFRIGGGAHPGRTCLNLMVDGAVVRTATGRNANSMHRATFDVSEFVGQRAQLQVVDAEAGGWGNIGIDEIVFSDAPCQESEVAELADFGSFCVSCIGPGGRVEVAEKSDHRSRVGSSVEIPAGQSVVVSFLVAWHFPNLQLPGLPGKKRWYASRWPDALAVTRTLADRLEGLAERTMAWRETWYDSTLPYWLLDRTFIPTDALATNTCHRFDDGRFWFWEGVGCCPGTCTHVWGYAQAIGRLFPEIERYLREEIDFGVAYHEDTGAIDYRAEAGRRVAHDGQCGCVLRTYREHLMSPDGDFLARIWPKVKRSLEHLIDQDRDGDGLLEGAQYNTLDADWYGPMAWISSLYLAAVSAGGSMARDMGDRAFAARCQKISALGSKSIVERLFDGEYFVHQPDPAHPEANSTNKGCHIDQVYGQAWAHQVGIGRVVPRVETRQALRSLWRYNFAPDVGVYRDWVKAVKGGRWYAVPGEGGLLMCTFPKGGAERATGQGQSAWAAMYMNECMTGFEYQVAAHMLWEGLVLEGLAITRAIHERYAPARRNPFNEIECSDHYGRAMAAYGVFLAACGWEYDGPRAALAFSPRIGPDDFRAAFTSAQGWGTIHQERSARGQRNRIALRHGRVVVRQVSVDLQVGDTATTVTGTIQRGTSEPLPVDIDHVCDGSRCQVVLAQPAVLAEGDELNLVFRH